LHRQRRSRAADQNKLIGMAIILGIDRFMSEARALTNMIGNGVATIVVSRWEKQLDVDQLNGALHTRRDPT
jgi:aerobic C4-dicarboxylate transport protein